MIYFTTDEYFEKMIKMGYVPSQMTNDNAAYLLKNINSFISYLFQEKILPEDYQVILNSGWRSAPFNESIGGAKNSAHVTGRAIDIGPDNAITRACEKDPKILDKFGLYAESAIDTPTWSHVTDRSPLSGNRIFRA